MSIHMIVSRNKAIHQQTALLAKVLEKKRGEIHGIVFSLHPSPFPARVPAAAVLLRCQMGRPTSKKHRQSGIIRCRAPSIDQHRRHLTGRRKGHKRVIDMLQESRFTVIGSLDCWRSGGGVTELDNSDLKLQDPPAVTGPAAERSMEAWESSCHLDQAWRLKDSSS